jgi:hypothetical protein
MRLAQHSMSPKDRAIAGQVARPPRAEPVAERPAAAACRARPATGRSSGRARRNIRPARPEPRESAGEQRGSGAGWADRAGARRMPFPPIRLGVNIDHVATVRNCARRPAARSGAAPPIRCGAHRGRGGRHHRASARGSPPHPRCGHRAHQGRDRQAAEFRDGRDRGNAGHCPAHQAACLLPRAGKARGTHHRGRAGCGGRCGAPQADDRPAEGRRASASRCSSRPSARRSRWRPNWAPTSSNCTPAPGASRWSIMIRRRMRPPARCWTGRRSPLPPGWRCMPATGSTTNRGKAGPLPHLHRVQHRPFPDR